MAQLAQHDDDFGSVGLAEARRQRIADLVGREVLILDVDGVARGGDHVEIQRFDFAHAGVAVDGRLGARDRRRRRRAADASMDGGQAAAGRVRPGAPEHASSSSTADRAFRASPMRQRSRTRSPSARAAGAFDRHHQVVKRRIRRAGHHAVLILRRVLARVPAARGQVDAAAERDRIVDDHDLLVMRAADRMRVVVAKWIRRCGFHDRPYSGAHSRSSPKIIG